MLRRGVRSRTIVRSAHLSDTRIYAHLQAAHLGGELVRTLQRVPTHLVVLDDSLATLAVDPATVTRGAIFIRIPSVVELMAQLFDLLWASADPIFTEATGVDSPTGRPARTLELVAAGLKDESVARSLGVGVRTVRRDIAELKQSLGVSSRTEIITAAVRRGWI
jgi:DNA-binding NarL/FixJ family response regulator